jgi:hypothetical protein
MTAKHYIRADNSFAGTVIGGNPPADATGEVPMAPADGRMIWHAGTSSWQWPVEVAQQLAFAKIAARFDQALAAGMPYAGKVLQIRQEDQSNIIAMGAKARDARDGNWTWPANFAWRMADDSFHPLPSYSDMIAMDLAAASEVYRLRQVRWHHVDTVAAMSDPAAIMAYDFSGGW